jgi:site-specific recombinase XerD
MMPKASKAGIIKLANGKMLCRSFATHLLGTGSDLSDDSHKNP